MLPKIVVLVLCCLVKLGQAKDPSRNHSQTGVRRFPRGFLFGAATAAYQVEGGWNEDGRTESIWDKATHMIPSPIDDGSTGDIAADSYHQYKRDVEMMRELGLDFYRLSLSWSRILPTGFVNEVNEAGIKYYNDLFDEMIKYNIKPMVTLYHWDLPQRLQDLGGFANPLFVEWFEDFAKVAYERFGQKVKIWITFNEPKQICYEGYGEVIKAPLLNASGVAEYLCARHLLLAHARAWHLYNDKFRSAQGGINGITISCTWFEAASDSEDDLQAANDARMFDVVPWGFYKLLTYMRETYNNPPIFITENGYSTRGGLEDDDRVEYYRAYLGALLDAVEEGSDVKGYTAWSLMDNFEWMRGYTEKFGLYEVDFTSLNRTRTARKSALVYKEIVRSRSLDPNYQPHDLSIAIYQGH